MIGGQGEDSFGKSGTDETPQERKRRGGSAAPAESEALHGDINCGVISSSAHVSHLFLSRLESFCYVPASFYHIN
ncbi:hypothetical protein ABEY50_19405 [Priestia megaterium]|uniref:hypothetical protein n=1 Tax=Priestia megaterium TaxID=1404 RepID=UPI0004BB5969|nr:hypothetical protein [Priestia megaterium]MDC7771166.1 hypothetical protein [Priestia megaterium]